MCWSSTDEPGWFSGAVDQVFLMKVQAGRAVDSDDHEALWPRCSFQSTEACRQSVLRGPYPLESHDPFLADRIATVVRPSWVQVYELRL